MYLDRLDGKSAAGASSRRHPSRQPLSVVSLTSQSCELFVTQPEGEAVRGIVNTIRRERSRASGESIRACKRQAVAWTKAAFAEPNPREAVRLPFRPRAPEVVSGFHLIRKLRGAS